ncbi:hypothetical protein RB195_022696 [Necator americanus]|uniref:Uncharacterized protein n=1 Tax=Necator americanus TaxID=51031 RepID=A0ABR1EGA6_NECAM
MSTPGERKFSQKLMGLEACNLPMGYQNGKGRGWRSVLARTLALEAAIEDLMQAKKIKYDVIDGLTKTRRRHPLNAVYETGEELF